MAPGDAPLRIFVSHSKVDDEFGVRLVDDLRRALGDDDTVWFDSHGGLHGGVAWWRTIVTEISERPIFIVILSPEALASTWVNDEIDLAWQQKNQPAGKQIIPVLYRQCKARADLTMLQFVSFVAPVSYEAGFDALLRALNSPPSGGRRILPTGAPAPLPPDAPATITTPIVGQTIETAPMPVVLPQGGALAGPTISQQAPTVVETPVTAHMPGTQAPPPVSLELDPSLLIFGVDDPAPPRLVALTKVSVTIGREAGNDIVLSDPTISRRHLRLTRESGMWQMERLPEAKPIHVNGVLLDDAVLRAGDQLVIGGTVIRIQPPHDPHHGKASPYAATLLRSHLAPTLHVECPNLTFDTALRFDTITLGRAPDRGVIVPSPLISTRHATMTRTQGGGYELDASQARNPFLLRGQPVTRRPLQHGDTLLIGDRGLGQFVTITYVVDRE